MLNQDGVCVGVKICLRLKLRDPTTKHFVGDGELAGLVVKLDDDVFSEVLRERPGHRAGAEIPDLVGPLLKLFVVSDSAVEGNGIVLGAAG